MSNREVRISLDGDVVAVRSDWPAEHEMAWGCMHAKHGGYWTQTANVADWKVVTETETPELPPAPQAPDITEVPDA
jgi:hypothetical protein